MNLQPIYDWVVIAQDKDPEKVGMIILPENHRKKLAQGTVISVGDGRVLANGTQLPPKVHPGDAVLFSDTAGQGATQLQVEGKDLILLQENAILCIVKQNT